MREADYDAIAIAEATGTPIVVWEDGEVRHVDPKEMRRRLAAKGAARGKAKKKPPRRNPSASSRRKKRAS